MSILLLDDSLYKNYSIFARKDIFELFWCIVFDYEEVRNAILSRHELQWKIIEVSFGPIELEFYAGDSDK